jgi:pimeloyl-ACP methyl ester carboxylesterase
MSLIQLLRVPVIGRHRAASARRAALAGLLTVTAVASAGAQIQPADSAPGRLIDLGGYRLHLFCTGAALSGGPTIVLSAGGGDYAVDWWRVQTAIADSSRVCSYDRAGSGWSDRGPEPRTLRQEAAELERLLKRAGEAGPFVLVGHSLGAQVVRLYQLEHPGDVVGMVLVAPTHEDTRLMVRGQLVQLRTLAQNRPIPAARFEAPSKVVTADTSCWARATAAARIVRPYDQLPAQAQRYRVWLVGHPRCGPEGEDYLPDEFEAMAARRARDPQPLGAIPLIVIAQGRLSTPPPNVSLDSAQREYADRMADLSRLSQRGRVVTDTLSGHHVHLDNPRVVVTAIRDVLRAAAGGRQ